MSLAKIYAVFWFVGMVAMACVGGYAWWLPIIWTASCIMGGLHHWLDWRDKGWA